MLGFVVLFFALFVGSHAYVWQRLVQAPAWPAPVVRFCSLVLLSGAVGAPLALMRHRTGGQTAAGPWLTFGLYWIGCFFFLFVSTAAVDALLRGLQAALAATGGALAPERRQWLLRAGALTSIAVATGMALMSRYTVAQGPRLREVEVSLSRLPRALDGLRIVQVSDLHVAPLLGRTYVEGVVDKVLASRPDVVVLTGDLVDGKVDELAADIAPLARLHAPQGVFLITGNHEYYSGADAWLAHLQTLGIRPLRNEHVTLGSPLAPLALAGIDDWTAHQFGGDHGADLPRALAGLSAQTPVVLLAHQPRAVDEAARAGVDLVLSGHTHGGQLWPFGLLVRLVQPYLSGLHQHGDHTQIYVHPGTGYWGPPMRLGAEAEVTLLVLRAPPAA